ncbi:hypothetical protein M378DRAFT_17869 [Amanita muscaria Koide BX008]|uniref:Uncharacterized protein n=1 Tax=Amanita muscaria (strain Koide BX008) TaxID=946122 RepID=A0A0C2W358_AMAMK|nr:hypothetical protein M378DRAFT_17869 [Amanita muscaria Koide BX008]
MNIIDLTMSSPPCSSPISYGSEDEDELDKLRQTIRKQGEAFRRTSEIYLMQVDHPNLKDGGQIWMKSQVDRGIGKDVKLMVEDVRRFEETARKKDSTWAMGKGEEERRRMKNTMGYQI